VNGAVGSGSLRAVVTCLLLVSVLVFGLGEWLLVRSYRMMDGSPGLSVTDLQMKFQQQSRSLFEARLRTDMREHLDEADLATLLSWARSGAPEQEYQRAVAGVLDDRCVKCHKSGGTAGFRSLETLEAVRATIAAPPSPPFREMVTVTKIHLVGIGLLLAVPTLVRPRSTAAARWQGTATWIAYGGLLLDFGAWWLMRLHLAFAALRGVGQVMLWAGFVVLTAGALYELWLRSDERVSRR
jgi:hypothetical protein